MIYVNWPSGAGGDFLISLGMIAHKISGIVCSPRNQFGESAKIGSEKCKVVRADEYCKLVGSNTNIHQFFEHRKNILYLTGHKKIPTPILRYCKGVAITVDNLELQHFLQELYIRKCENHEPDADVLGEELYDTNALDIRLDENYDYEQIISGDIDEFYTAIGLPVPDGLGKKMRSCIKSYDQANKFMVELARDDLHLFQTTRPRNVGINLNTLDELQDWLEAGCYTYC